MAPFSFLFSSCSDHCPNLTQTTSTGPNRAGLTVWSFDFVWSSQNSKPFVSRVVRYFSCTIPFAFLCFSCWEHSEPPKQKHVFEFIERFLFTSCCFWADLFPKMSKSQTGRAWILTTFLAQSYSSLIFLLLVPNCPKPESELSNNKHNYAVSACCFHSNRFCHFISTARTAVKN